MREDTGTCHAATITGALRIRRAHHTNTATAEARRATGGRRTRMTDRPLATIGAEIRVDKVTIITGLGRVENAISTVSACMIQTDIGDTTLLIIRACTTLSLQAQT